MGDRVAPHGFVGDPRRAARPLSLRGPSSRGPDRGQAVRAAYALSLLDARSDRAKNRLASKAVP
jgi:hypothetical protein